jgi:hypothetical protein
MNDLEREIKMGETGRYIPPIITEKMLGKEAWAELTKEEQDWLSGKTLTTPARVIAKRDALWHPVPDPPTTE